MKLWLEYNSAFWIEWNIVVIENWNSRLTWFYFYVSDYFGIEKKQKINEILPNYELNAEKMALG